MGFYVSFWGFFLGGGGQELGCLFVCLFARGIVVSFSNRVKGDIPTS